MKEYLKRILPAWIQYPLYRFIWNPLRFAYWGCLRLECFLPSGLHVEIRNRSDWEIFTEVVVNGEYDFPIQFTLDQRDRTRSYTVVDLGANVGYFTFRCADRFLQRFGRDDRINITAVEGSPVVFAELKRRVSAEELLRPRVKLLMGLVGNRRGEAYIGGSHIHYSNVISSRATLGAALVPFVDLAELLSNLGEVDLLKCDVEGAEFDLIENYKDVLNKVRAMVIEFHRYGRDIERSRSLLHSYGFENRRNLRETSTFSVEFYWRDESSR